MKNFIWNMPTLIVLLGKVAFLCFCSNLMINEFDFSTQANLMLVQANFSQT